VTTCKAPFIAFSRCSGPICQTFGDDDSRSVTPRKPKDAAQIAFNMLEGGRRHARAIKTAARNRDDHALVARQPFGAGGGIAEGLAGDRDAVDPGLELAGDAEIVHGRADDDDVGGQEFLKAAWLAAMSFWIAGDSGTAPWAAARCSPDRCDSG